LKHVWPLVSLMLLCILFILFAVNSFDNRSSRFSNTTSRPDPKTDVRSKLDLDFTWRKEGFGNVMEANFKVKNNSDYTIKDIKITCEHFAPSGTNIDSNKSTIYEVVKARSSKRFNNYNMGFIHSQARSSSCRISDFKIVQRDYAPSTSGSSIKNEPEVEQIQFLLNKLNYNVGQVDGIIGPKTISAIKAFERDAGLPETGEASANLLLQLRKRN